MSSIRKEISADILANQIRMERAQNKNVTIVLVEGDTDARLFRRFLDARVSLSVCFDRERVLGVLDRLETGQFNGVVAIIDADFDLLRGTTLPSPNVCRTDGNDVEGMILPAVIAKILSEFGSDQAVAADEAASGAPAIDVVISEASKIGALRLVSHLSNAGLKFDGMDYKFVSNSGIEIDVAATVAHVVARSRTKPDLTDLEAAVRAMLSRHGASALLCQGHDMIRILGRGLRRRWGSTAEFDSSKKVENLEKILRVAYEERDFQQTGLHACLLAWEASHAPWRVF